VEQDRRRRVAAFQFPPLPGSSGLPVQFVITTTEPFENLNTVAQAGAGQGARLGQVLLRRQST
jgi:multidrug efflux pump